MQTEPTVYETKSTVHTNPEFICNQLSLEPPLLALIASQSNMSTEIATH